MAVHVQARQLLIALYSLAGPVLAGGNHLGVGTRRVGRRQDVRLGDHVHVHVLFVLILKIVQLVLAAAEPPRLARSQVGLDRSVGRPARGEKPRRTASSWTAGTATIAASSDSETPAEFAAVAAAVAAGDDADSRFRVWTATRPVARASLAEVEWLAMAVDSGCRVPRPPPDPCVCGPSSELCVYGSPPVGSPPGSRDESPSSGPCRWRSCRT